MIRLTRPLAHCLVIIMVCYTPRGLDITRQGSALASQRRGTAATSERVGPNLLMPEETLNPFNQTFPGCWLGGQFYMVGDRWSPSIEPLGVMYCVKCQCAQIVKNKQVQLKGKIVCSNIKADCPRVTCDQPILRPQTCCQVCPGQEPFFEDQFGQSVEPITTEAPPTSGGGMDTNEKPDMSALLVGSTLTRRKPVRTRAVAACHVTDITESSFRYVIRFARLKSPTQLRFCDQYGKVLLEKPLPRNRARSRRLSGLWADVPFIAIQYIIKELAFVTIVTVRHRTGEISGRLKVNRMTSTATFEAVLTPPTQRGFGAFAQMFYDDVTSIGSYVINIDGLKFLHQDEFFVTFEKDTEIIHQHILRISQSRSQVVGKLTIDKTASKQLARGRLHLRVTSRTGETMTGVLRPRMQRNDLLAVFHGEGTSSPEVAGFVALTLEEDGAIRYKVVANGYEGAAVSVSLQRGSQKRWQTFASLPSTPDLHTSDQLTRAGYYKKLRAKDTSAVLENHLRLEVKLGNGNDVIHSFLETSTTETVDIFSASHAILRTAGCSENVIVLYSVTSYCTFAYHVISRNSTSLESTLTSSLRLSDVYSFRESSVTGSPEGTITNIPDNLWRSLRGGEAVISWHISYGNCDETASQRITVPNKCVAPSRPVPGPGGNEAERGTNEMYRCYHEGKFYTQGDTWAPGDIDQCVTCRCDKGNVFCEEMPCPPTECLFPRKRDEECCPICEDDNDTERKVLGSCYYHGDKRWHPVGSIWHPYVPPFGYSKCAVCTCLAGSLEVNCTRLPCPALECPGHQRTRLNKEDCCQVCKDCYFGNNVYKHGQKWHPWLTPFGEMKCYICSCKNGKTRCKKLRCPRLSCGLKYYPADQCCPVCRDSSSITWSGERTDELSLNLGES